MWLLPSAVFPHLETLLCSLCTWDKKDSVNEVPKPSGMDFFLLPCLNWDEAQLYSLWVFLGIVVLTLSSDSADCVRGKGKDCLQYWWVAVIWMFVFLIPE